jgi:hypothetical protein
MNMKKITSAIVLLLSVTISFAQILKPVRIQKTEANKEAVNQANKPVATDAFKKEEQTIKPIIQLDETLVAATESIQAKMKDVVNKANGFKDDKLTEVINSTKVKGYYRNTNNADGAIYYNPVRKKSVFIYGEVRKFYDSQGGCASYMDYPVSDVTIVKSGIGGEVGQQAVFENACITINPQRKLQVVFGQVYEKYRSVGGATSNLGFAASDRVKYTSNSYAQLFDGGMIITNNNDAFIVKGKIREKYNYKDCGLPMADATTEKGNSIMVFIVNTQKFEKYVIVSSTRTPACFVKNEIYKKWMTYGNTVNNTCGLPTSDAADNGSMTAQNFEKGLMLLVNGKVTFVPDDNEKNTEENNKIRETNKLGTIKFTPLKIN